MRGFTEEEVEDQSRAARKAAGVDDQHQPDLMTIIIAFKSAFPPFNYKRCTEDELPDVEASWDADKQLLLMREQVFREMNLNKVRARFTVAHEIGHFWLKHEGIRNRSIVPTAAERLVSRIRKQEREAQRFAPAFLAPAHLIDPYASVEKIMETFLISKPAAILRSEELQRIHRRKHGLERPLPQFVVDFLIKNKK